MRDLRNARKNQQYICSFLFEFSTAGESIPVKKKLFFVFPLMASGLFSVFEQTIA